MLLTKSKPYEIEIVVMDDDGFVWSANLTGLDSNIEIGGDHYDKDRDSAYKCARDTLSSVSVELFRKNKILFVIH